ncbi:TIGR02206 family membrane protein [Atopobacter sp. AH10]|uniref:YwaF family protein n=1 Tax=Atopobacter sp. AH10 TaxID=2315861 RepID=UPI001314CDF4|nr:TIGR02206 family membrane protein [Atopobacter sp. AH10]
MAYFFRGHEDGYRFPSFSLIHVLLVLLLLAGAYVLFKYRDEIRANRRWEKGVKLSFMTLIVLDQVLYIGFCFFSRPDGLQQALPLYTCRAALYTGFLALLTDHKVFKALTVYWGLFGGILPLVYPDMMAYSWPHFTNIHYFLLHFLVFWMANYFLLVEGYDSSRSNSRLLYSLVNAFLLLALGVNLYVKGNYAYLMEAPLLKTFFLEWPKLLYWLFTFSVYNALVWCVQQMCVKILIPQFLPEESSKADPLKQYH